MKTRDSIHLLQANIGRSAVFISDPTYGDRIIVGDETLLASIGDLTDVNTLLGTLDFEAYEGDGPEIEIRGR